MFRRLLGIKTENATLFLSIYGVSNPELDTWWQSQYTFFGNVMAEANIMLIPIYITDLPWPNPPACNFKGAIGKDFIHLEQSLPAKSVRTFHVLVYPKLVGRCTGCHFPLTGIVMVSRRATPEVLAHEVGHTADLLHSPNVNNLMANGLRRKDTNLTAYQRFLLRTNRFNSYSR